MNTKRSLFSSCSSWQPWWWVGSFYWMCKKKVFFSSFFALRFMMVNRQQKSLSNKRQTSLTLSLNVGLSASARLQRFMPSHWNKQDKLADTKTSYLLLRNLDLNRTSKRPFRIQRTSRLNTHTHTRIHTKCVYFISSKINTDKLRFSTSQRCFNDKI